MKLNCKPGDLAILVRVPPEFTKHLGMIVRVTRLRGDSPLGPGWEYLGRRIYLRDGVPATGIEDAFLRPIRDPGEDARDETLEWLPVPTRTPETA